MLFKKRIAAVLMAGVLALSGAAMTGCSQDEATASAADRDYYTNSKTIDVDDMFTERDLSAAYDDTNVKWIKLGREDQVTITEEGTYVVSGTLEDGKILVDAPDDAKVQIVLKGADITCSDSAAILVKNANKVFVTAESGTLNSLTVSGEYADSEDEDLSGVDGVIFSKVDLTVNGEGSLTIKGKAGHGIVAKDDLVLAGLDLTVKAGKKAIDANDSVRIASGSYVLKAGTDGIHAADEDKDTGYVYIADGTIRIKAGDDGIHANTDLIVDGGTLNVKKCQEGLEGNTVTINDGNVNVVSKDDGINAAARNRSKSTGAEDTGAADQSRGFGQEGGGMEYYDESCIIMINGGTIHIDADGDGIDSNGSITITGGATSVEGPENSGNGILDVGGQGKATITGGTFIATGSAGMAVQFSEESTQGCILATVDAQTGATPAAKSDPAEADKTDGASEEKAGNRAERQSDTDDTQTAAADTHSSTVTLTDTDGNVIASQQTDKMYSCVQISAPDITTGSTYTLDADGNKTEIKMDSLIYGGTAEMQGGGMQDGRPGQMQRPDAEGESQDGTTPDGSPEAGNTDDGRMKKRPDGQRPEGPPNGEKPSGHPDGKPSKRPGGSKTDDGSSDTDNTEDASGTQEL